MKLLGFSTISFHDSSLGPSHPLPPSHQVDLPSPPGPHSVLEVPFSGFPEAPGGPGTTALPSGDAVDYTQLSNGMGWDSGFTNAPKPPRILVL